MNKGDKLPENENLFRRVYRNDKKYIDPSGRPSSRAFTPRPKDDGKLSVDIERLTTPEQCVRDIDKFALFRICTTLAYELGLDCIYDPLTMELHNCDNIAHSLIVGIPEDDESISGTLSRNSHKVI